jgi:hypothetical protein
MERMKGNSMTEPTLDPSAKWEGLLLRCREEMEAWTEKKGYTPDKATINSAVADREWQFHRALMRGCTDTDKFRLCLEYFDRHADRFYRAVRIYNYINALKRGGLVK